MHIYIVLYVCMFLYTMYMSTHISTCAFILHVCVNVMCVHMFIWNHYLVLMMVLCVLTYFYTFYTCISMCMHALMHILIHTHINTKHMHVHIIVQMHPVHIHNLLINTCSIHILMYICPHSIYLMHMYTIIHIFVYLHTVHIHT